MDFLTVFPFLWAFAAVAAMGAMIISAYLYHKEGDITMWFGYVVLLIVSLCFLSTPFILSFTGWNMEKSSSNVDIFYAAPISVSAFAGSSLGMMADRKKKEYGAAGNFFGGTILAVLLFTIGGCVLHWFFPILWPVLFFIF